MQKKSASILVHLPETTKKLITRLAAEEDRTISTYTLGLIKHALAIRGLVREGYDDKHTTVK